MRRLSLLLPFLLVLASCRSSGGTSSNASTPYRIIAEENAKTCIVGRNGAPITILSTEFRNDIFKLSDGVNADGLEDYFALAKETGFNTIDLPFMWSQFETSKDTYIYDELETYLNYAKKYELKFSLIWYGSFVDGETHTINMPDYINKDKETYPILQYCYPDSIFGDAEIIDWTDKDLIDRETKAIKNLLNYVGEWNERNDQYDPVIIFQIGQGMDRLQRYRMDQYEIKIDGVRMTIDKAQYYVTTYATAISKAIKASRYVPLTRVEFCEQESAKSGYVKFFSKIKTIDILSTTYLYTVLSCRKGMTSFSDSLGASMPIMNSENWANDDNYRSALVAFAMGGCGFNTYNLSSPQYYPLEDYSGALYHRKNFEGKTIGEKFTEINTRASDIKLVNKIINKGYFAFSKALKENFALFGFNSGTKTGGVNNQKIYFDQGIMLDYKASDKAYAYACFFNNYIYVISSENATLNVSNCFIQAGSTGSFDKEGFWQSEEKIQVNIESDIDLKKETLYRFRVGNIQELPDSSTLKELGYIDTINSIKE